MNVVSWMGCKPLFHRGMLVGRVVVHDQMKIELSWNGSIHMLQELDEFSVLRTRTIAGRVLSSSDRAQTLPVAVVNETFVRTFFAGKPVLGERIQPEFTTGREPAPARTIVGVVADIRDSFARDIAPTVYVPWRQVVVQPSSLVIRTASGANPGPAVARAVAGLDPLVAEPNVTDLAALVSGEVATRRLSLVTLIALAGLALALSVAGTFAVVSYAATKRTHEFGIRMALGAGTRRILLSLVWRAVRLAIAGIVVGLPVAALAAQYLRDQLFETGALDPATFAFVTLLIVLVSIVAALVPAIRAARVDPAVALRLD